MLAGSGRSEGLRRKSPEPPAQLLYESGPALDILSCAQALISVDISLDKVPSRVPRLGKQHLNCILNEWFKNERIEIIKTNGKSTDLRFSSLSGEPKS